MRSRRPAPRWPPASPRGRVDEGLASASRACRAACSRAASPGEVLVIDDTLQRQSAVDASALETLARLETTGARIAVLGDMGELGEPTRRPSRGRPRAWPSSDSTCS